jgi:hypothetical protein
VDQRGGRRTERACSACRCAAPARHRGGRAACADPSGSLGAHSGSPVHRRSGEAQLGALANGAPEPVHGSERPQQPARRRLHDKHLPVVGAARQQHADALDLPELRVRVTHIRQRRTDRGCVRRARSASAVDVRPQDTRPAGCDAAAAAQPEHGKPVQPVLGRRLLLSRPTRPRGHPDHQRSDLGRRRDERRNRPGVLIGARIRRQRRHVIRRSDRLGAARLERPDLVRHQQGRGRHSRPGRRRGQGCEPVGASTRRPMGRRQSHGARSIRTSASSSRGRPRTAREPRRT